MRKSRARKAFVTGGTGGIGGAIVAALKEQEVEVTAPRRSEMDLARSDSVDEYLASAAFEVDIVVNCAGVNVLSDLEGLKEEDLDEVFKTNFFSAIKILKRFMPGMRQRKYGRVVNVESIYAFIARERRLAYTSSKCAMSGLTRTLAVEYGRDNVLVNAVCPGYVNTEMTMQGLSKSELHDICARIPLGRLAEPWEIANVVAFLCSSQNTYINGQLLVVDGGFICR
jgi:3-oxoacyl-[acyl-carrier protein] reductase